MTVICYACGIALPGNARFCSKCGAAISVKVLSQAGPQRSTIQKPGEVQTNRSSFSLASGLGTLRDQIDPNYIKRAQAKNLLIQSRNLENDFITMNGEAYTLYMNDDKEEALKLFVSATKIKIEAGRLVNEANEIFTCLGYGMDSCDLPN